MKPIFSLFFLLIALKAHPINPLLESLYFPSYAQFLDLEPHFVIKKSALIDPFNGGIPLLSNAMI